MGVLVSYLSLEFVQFRCVQERLPSVGSQHV